MRIVLLTSHYSPQMGYIENVLPKVLVQLGAEVHIVTSRLKGYFWLPEYERTYGGFCRGPADMKDQEELYQGCWIHYLPHRIYFHRVRLIGLYKKLKALRPDIVQTIAPSSLLEIEAALAKPALGYKLFTGCHMAPSVFPLARDKHPFFCWARVKNMIGNKLPGMLVNLAADKCYGAAQCSADLAVQYFGVSKKKSAVSVLGVDTEVFFPIDNAEMRAARSALRRTLGFEEGELVCIYTGRYSEDKNPLLLAQAVSRLFVQGEPFRGLFVGEGIQGDRIKVLPGCVVHPFVHFRELGHFMRAAEIGVLPTQESTSMLDAAACGLPIVVNHTMGAMERIDGNGLTYRLNDLDDLVRVLLVLRDSRYRERLGNIGAERMLGEFSWLAIARRRLGDYSAAVTLAKDRKRKET